MGESIVSVTLGFAHSSVFTSSSRLYLWGKNDYNILGDETNEIKIPLLDISLQFNLMAGESIDSVSLGGAHSSALTSMGRVFTWGSNNCIQLGDYSTYTGYKRKDITSMFKLIVGEKIVSVSLGLFHSSALTSLGRVFTWGRQYFGEFLLSDDDPVCAITRFTWKFGLSEGESIVYISLGSAHSLFTTSLGRTFTWGSNSEGQLGDGTTTDSYTPVDITSRFDLTVEETIDSASLGFAHSSVLTSLGKLFVWGRNDFGQLGDGTTSDRHTPIDITSRFNLDDREMISSISFGGVCSSALTSFGRVLVWGRNHRGQLGDKTTTDRHTPTEITSQFNLKEGENIISLSLGFGHSSALSSLGRVFTFGNNQFYQLGVSTMEYSSKPIEITLQFNLREGERILSVSLGGSHSSALSSLGRLFMWGNNEVGQLGDVTIPFRPSPTEIKFIRVFLSRNEIFNIGEEDDLFFGFEE